MDRYVDFMKGQLKEIVSNYHPGILWFDGEWESPWTHERGVDLYNYVRSLQPDIIINNRVGKGRAGMNGMDENQGVGDYGTPEQEIPATGFGPGVDWESCMTMNNHWGFNRADQNWKTTTTLVRNLIDCSSKGGNYLLNVGPTAEGTFPDASVERLAEIGQWMKVNKEAIHGTTASPFKLLPWGRATKRDLGSKGTKLYLHVFDWPANGNLEIPGLKAEVIKTTLLTPKGAKKLQASRTESAVVVNVPATAPSPHSSTVVLQLKAGWSVEPSLLTQGNDGSVKLPASMAEIMGKHARFESGENRNSIGFWTDPKDTVSWQFKITQPGRFLVKALLASTSESAFQVSVQSATGHHALEAKAPNTGDYGKFQEVEVGSFDLSKGAATLQVTPSANHWQPVNLRSVTLTPAK
jgi:alpha-L-fucosidase